MRSINHSANISLIFAILLVVLCSTVLMVPVAMNDLFFHEANYNEGWNIYHAMRVAHGEALYDGDLRRIVNYPYISFYLIALLGDITNTPLIVARALSFSGFIFVTTSCAICVRIIGGSRAASFLAAALFVGFCAIAVPKWIGTADPQFLAQGLGALGLVLHLSAKTKTRRLVSAPICLVLSVFTKQQEITIPIVIMADMAFCHRDELFRWLVIMGTLALSCTAIGFLAGEEFLIRVAGGRGFSIYTAIGTTRRMLELVQVPVAIGLLWLIVAGPPRYRTLLVVFGGVSVILMAGFSGGDGVSWNVAVDFFMWIAIVAGLGATGLQNSFVRGRMLCTILVLLVGFEIELQSFLAIGQERLRFAELMQNERDFRSDVEFMADRRGDAICESMLLCYFSGKPLIVDPYNSAEMVTLGKLSVDKLTELLTQRRIATIQLSSVLERDGKSGLVSNENLRFNREFLNVILTNYTLEHISSGGAFYVPNH
jgi:hypothetical protein